jgi:hypothetical protein
MASGSQQTSEHGTASKRECLTIPHRLEIIMRLESWKSWREGLASFGIGLSAIYNTKNWKDQLLFIASSESVKGLECDRFWKSLISTEGQVVV